MNGPATRQLDRLRIPVDPVDRSTQVKIDVMVRVKVLGPEKETLEFHLSKKVSLRERRTLVWRDGFCAYHGDGTLEPRMAELGHKAAPGLPAAHYNNVRHHPSPIALTTSGRVVGAAYIPAIGKRNRRGHAMTIAVGDTLPEATFLRIGAEGPEEVSLQSLTEGKKIVIFGLPGAYTRTCTAAHVPSFIRTKPGFDEKGVSDIICVSVNDPFVMMSWGESTGATEAGLLMLADPAADFTKAIGMDFTAPPVGFYDRAKRHAMVVDNGVVTALEVETSPGECTISAGESLLEKV